MTPVRPLLAVAALLVLTACSTQPEDVDLGDSVIPTPESAVATTTVDPSASPEATPTQAAPSPAPDTCVDLDEAPDGVYPVADAGSATVVVRDDRLVVGAIQPGADWRHDIRSEDVDEVEIEFSREGAELDLQVELHDGGVTVEVCADDD